jgi:hypothetical protein
MNYPATSIFPALFLSRTLQDIRSPTQKVETSAEAKRSILAETPYVSIFLWDEALFGFARCETKGHAGITMRAFARVSLGSRDSVSGP